jgi:hypothetical protein
VIRPKLTKMILVKMTDEMFTTLAIRAQKAGITPSEFIRTTLRGQFDAPTNTRGFDT